MRDPAHWLKPLLFIGGLLPLLSEVYRAAFGILDVDPIETLHHAFGGWALRFLLFTLLITPLRMIPGWSWASKLRRMIGLFAFLYATLHLAVYVVLDQQFDWTAIGEDIFERSAITVGVSAYLLLLPLAVTSNHTMMLRLGHVWKRLHALIYLITALGIMHFYLLVKGDRRESLLYASLFVVLVILRRLLAGRKAD